MLDGPEERVDICGALSGVERSASVVRQIDWHLWTWSFFGMNIFALRGSMNRKNQLRSKLRGMNPVAIQGARKERIRGFVTDE